MKQYLSAIGRWLKSAVMLAFGLGPMFAFGSQFIDLLVQQNLHFSQGVVERWICPAGSSIQRDEKAFTDSSSDAAPRLLVLVLSSCVDEQGAVVREGYDFDHPNPIYFEFLGTYCLATMAAEGIVLAVPIWLLARKTGRT